MIRVLFVCLGNICRSPTAHGVLRAELESVGGEAATIVSAEIMPGDGPFGIVLPVPLGEVPVGDSVLYLDLGYLGTTDPIGGAVSGDGPYHFNNLSPISALCVNTAGQTIVGTEAGMIARLDGQAQQTFDGPFKFGAAVATPITALACDEAGNVFAGTEGGHIGKLNDTTLGTTGANGPYRYGVSDPAVSPISLLAISGEGNLIVGTATGTVALLDPNTLGNVVPAVQLTTSALTSMKYIVPEPATLLLVALGGLAAVRRRR